MAAQIAPLLPDWGASPLAKLEQRIIKVLTERGPIKRRDLTALSANRRKWTPQDMKRTVDAMLDNGTLTLTAPGVIGLA